MRRYWAIFLLGLLMVDQVSIQKANAQAAAAAVPIGAAIVIMGGISYYLWYDLEGQRQTAPVQTGEYMEDPEELDQWAEYPSVRTYQGCRWQAAGREWDWDATNKKCYIKG